MYVQNTILIILECEEDSQACLLALDYVIYVVTSGSW